ncbi:RNA ligase family protein [Deinococcus ruber]|uniref:RNA ligase domain-containing protein n=1 Tax=Deinococcus ruber TaxID=1848197 RepID=A0A918C3B3_9DEIO|nr:RNA ligase family protein [Deinococcus ruber]GGR03699.1 hypothetical protein GCM10008957_15770 [Deinococcus ruber]
MPHLAYVTLQTFTVPLRAQLGTMNDRFLRPLGGKAYGRVAHLPGSRQGAGERQIAPELVRRLTVSPRSGDQVWVQEKLDGTNLSVLRLGDELVALTRAGYRAANSRRIQGRLFAVWVQTQAHRFLDVLQPGERVVGEWLLFAHGTHYVLPHEPFVVFDIMQGTQRLPLRVLTNRLSGTFILPFVHAQSAALPATVYDALTLPGHHGAATYPEGLIYRLEHGDHVECVAKWVRPNYRTGQYFQDDEAVIPNTLRPEDQALLTSLEQALSGVPVLPD